MSGDGDDDDDNGDDSDDDIGGFPHLSPATIAGYVVGVEGSKAGHSVLQDKQIISRQIL